MKDSTLTLHVSDVRGDPCPQCAQPREYSILISGVPGQEPRTVFGCRACGWARFERPADFDDELSLAERTRRIFTPPA